MIGAPPARDLLHRWLDTQATTMRAFADQLDVSPETLSRWCSGRLKPSKIAKLAIEYLTDHHVPVTAWDAPVASHA